MLLWNCVLVRTTTSFFQYVIVKFQMFRKKKMRMRFPFCLSHHHTHLKISFSATFLSSRQTTSEKGYNDVALRFWRCNNVVLRSCTDWDVFYYVNWTHTTITLKRYVLYVKDLSFFSSFVSFSCVLSWISFVYIITPCAIFKAPPIYIYVPIKMKSNL